MNRERILHIGVVAVTVALVWYGLLSSSPPSEIVRPEPVATEPGLVATSPLSESAVSPPTADVRRPTEAQKRSAGQDQKTLLRLRIIRSTDRLPIADINVTIRHMPDGEPSQDTSASNGLVETAVAPGEYLVTIDEADYFRFEQRIGVPQETAEVSREIVLTPAIHAQGVVVDQYGGPVEGAIVHATPEEGTALGNVDETDASGFFSVRASPGTYILKAAKKPHPTAMLGPLVLDTEAERSLLITMVLLDGLTLLAGEVVSEAGQPLSEAFVRIRKRDGSQREQTLSWTTTDERGRFSFEFEPEPELRLTVSASGFRDAEVEIDGRSDLDVQLRLAAYELFSVRVVDVDGRPVSARIHGTSEADLVAIEEGPGGRYYSKSYPCWIWADAFETGKGVTERFQLNGHRSEVVLRIQPGAELRGRVVGPDGNPVKRLSMAVTPTGLGRLSRTVNSEDGSFRQVDLPPGPAKVTISALGYDAHSEEVHLSATAITWIEIALRRRPPRR